LLANEHHNVSYLKELQLRIAQSDESAFTEVYVYFDKRLVHFASNLVRSSEIAEEIVEDVFVKVWNNRASIGKIDNLSVYLYVAVKNQALNTLSQKAKDLVSAPFDYLEIPSSDLAANPYDLMITSEMMGRMQQAIEALPPRCKMIFKLIREDGLKYKEVSAILNISVNTIDAQMAIAVKKICEALNIERLNRKPQILQDQPVSKKS
jgi:RNA polymerase sigma-70 factor (family 1)